MERRYPRALLNNLIYQPTLQEEDLGNKEVVTQWIDSLVVLLNEKRTPWQQLQFSGA